MQLNDMSYFNPDLVMTGIFSHLLLDYTKGFSNPTYYELGTLILFDYFASESVILQNLIIRLNKSPILSNFLMTSKKYLELSILRKQEYIYSFSLSGVVLR